MNNYAYTIAAISTPPGKGGVAIIRISGTEALAIADKVFAPANKKSFTEATPRMQIRGNIVSAGEVIDDGMATYFKAPFSYTGEDTVEIACHGGVLVTRSVLEAILAAGASLAGAGEFTRRALINGKLSLTSAEAIGNLLEAESDEQVKLASARSRALLEGEIGKIRGDLTSLLSSIYARIDYPDEDLGDFTDEQTLEKLRAIKCEADALLSTYRTGKAVNEGIKTVICGKPNVGKSSIYNLLLRKDAAIVTDIEGTTRDVLSEKLPLGRVMLNLSDTAGVRSKTSDPIEKIGIERSIKRIEESELIIAVFDLSRKLDEEDLALIEEIKKSNAAKIALLNKADLERRMNADIASSFEAVIEISTTEGIEKSRNEITDIINKLFTDERITIGDTAIISSARQCAALTRAISAIESAILAFESGMCQDAASSDIEIALGAIAELDGRAVSEEVVADIFAKFCVGK